MKHVNVIPAEAARAIRKARIDAKMAHPSMNINHQFMLMTDSLVDVVAAVKPHLTFEVR